MDSKEKSKFQLTKMLFVIVAAAILVMAGLKLAQKSNDSAKPNTGPSSNQAATDSNEQKKTEYLSYQGEDGKTVLELLKSQAEIETKSSSLGDYVVSINGNDGGGSKYWLFYVDGKESTVGAGAYVTKTGENIEWKLQ